MNKEELAAQLNGIQYPAHRAITQEQIQAAKNAGLVILYGASDDLMEFEGAAREEIGCYGGGEAWVDALGVLPDRDSIEGDEDLRPYLIRKESARKIEALWCKEEGYSWTYRTDIPNAIFEVMDEGEIYCRGIVFALADL